MKDRYFLFDSGKAEIFSNEQELNKKINAIFKLGVPLADIWAIKGERLQITIKELVATELEEE